MCLLVLLSVVVNIENTWSKNMFLDQILKITLTDSHANTSCNTLSIESGNNHFVPGETAMTCVLMRCTSKIYGLFYILTFEFYQCSKSTYVCTWYFFFSEIHENIVSVNYSAIDEPFEKQRQKTKQRIKLYIKNMKLTLCIKISFGNLFAICESNNKTV